MTTVSASSAVTEIEMRVRKGVRLAIGAHIEAIPNPDGQIVATVMVEMYRKSLTILLNATKYEVGEWADARALLPRTAAELLLSTIEETEELPPDLLMELKYTVAMLRVRRGMTNRWPKELGAPASKFSMELSQKFDRVAASSLVLWSGSESGLLQLDQTIHLFGDRNFTADQLARRRKAQWSKVRQLSGLSAEKFAKRARIPRCDFYGKWLRGIWSDESEKGIRILTEMWAMRQDQCPSPGRRATRRW